MILVKVEKNGLVQYIKIIKKKAITSVSSVTTTPISQLEELGIDDLISLLEHLHEIVSFVRVARREKSVGRPGLLSAPSASYSVHVIFRARRIIEIDHELDIFNVWNEQGNIL